MPNKPLKQFLDDAIVSYLEIDNPALKEKAYFWQPLFFKCFRKEGRDRAFRYQEKLAKIKHEHDLIYKIYLDSNPLIKNDLGSSKKLRYKLVYAVCHYLGVSPERIEAKMQEIFKYSMSYQNYGASYDNEFEFKAMRSLILSAYEDRYISAVDKTATYLPDICNYT